MSEKRLKNVTAAFLVPFLVPEAWHPARGFWKIRARAATARFMVWKRVLSRNGRDFRDMSRMTTDRRTAQQWLPTSRLFFLSEPFSNRPFLIHKPCRSHSLLVCRFGLDRKRTPPSQ